MVAGLAMGSDLVARHLAWSLDLPIPASLNSQSNLLGVCCNWSVSGHWYSGRSHEPYVLSSDSSRSDFLLHHWVKLQARACAGGGCHCTRKTSQLGGKVRAAYGSP